MGCRRVGHDWATEQQQPEAKASLIAQSVKNLPTMQETRARFQGWEDRLENGVAAGILAWRIPWTEEPAGYSPWGHKSWTWLSDWNHQPPTLSKVPAVSIVCSSHTWPEPLPFLKGPLLEDGPLGHLVDAPCLKEMNLSLLLIKDLTPHVPLNCTRKALHAHPCWCSYPWLF